MTIIFGGMGVQPTLRGQPTNVISLQAGATWLIPAGTWLLTPGLYSCVQELDGVTGIWRTIGSGLAAGGSVYQNSDGNNFRIANQSGCAVGAVVTTAGAGYTAAPPTITMSAGGAIMKAIVGGAVNTSVTVTNGGTGYTYAPIVTFDAPLNGAGVQATGHCTLSGGVVSTITVDDQGAGYTTTPNVYLKNDPRELNPASTSVTAGSGATAVATLTGSGTVTAILAADHGSAVTSLPTLAFAGTSTSGAAATAIMNWSVTGYTVTSTGGFYTTPVLITGYGAAVAAGSTTNPTITTNLVRTRPARINGVITAGSLTATGATIIDGGVYTGVPTLVAVGFASGTPAQPTATVGGTQDVTLLSPV